MAKKSVPREKAVDKSRAQAVRGTGEHVTGGKRSLRIASYNINGITSRLEQLLRWLGEFQPDIACLQELKAPDERFPADALERAGYTSIWHGQKHLKGQVMSGGTVGPSRRGAYG